MQRHMACRADLPTPCQLLANLCCCAALQSVDYSALIRGTFTGDNGLKGTVNRLPIERQFKLDNVKAVRPCVPWLLPLVALTAGQAVLASFLVMHSLLQLACSFACLAAPFCQQLRVCSWPLTPTPARLLCRSVARQTASKSPSCPQSLG